MKARRFLSAEWRHLAMLNYEVDPKLLRPLVPPGTELDFWKGKAYISLVGFRFLETRVLGWPLPFHRHFEEVNLRFYVRRECESGARRGVVFIREIVPRYAVALIARHAYDEPYVSLPMRHAIELGQKGVSTLYEWRLNGQWNRLYAQGAGNPCCLIEGSCEQFITEHYWGYTARPRGGALEYQVEHPSWRVWNCSGAGFEGDVAELYGADFAAIVQRPPDSAFIAEGSPVGVYRPCQISVSSRRKPVTGPSPSM